MSDWVEGLAREWIAAGFSPVAVWGQTPRAIVFAVEAAHLRERRKLADLALASWHGAHATADELRDFMRACRENVEQMQPTDALPAIVASMSANLGKMTMADYQALQRARGLQ